MVDAIRIGGGSAFFNDRLDAAVELIEYGGIDVLMLETLAERTLAQLQAAKQRGGSGYWEGFRQRAETLLPLCSEHGTALVTNAGGAAPLEAGRMIAAVAGQYGLKGMTIGVITGDDVLDMVLDTDPALAETGEPVSRLGSTPVSANAYLGADGIRAAYEGGADVIVTGRVTDSALALGPMLAAFNIDPEDYAAAATGIIAGHVLECGGQLTGGYFADPGLKEVPDLDRIGFPIAEIRRDLTVTISKPPNSGGRIDRHTVTEQLLYEMHDPARYLTPDVTLDITELELAETGPDEVRLIGARGSAPPDTLKVLVGVDSGFLVEAEISYAGINAVPRARLAAETVKRRLTHASPIGNAPVRYDLIGVNSTMADRALTCDPPEVRLRVAARVGEHRAAERVVTEVESLYVNGPAGGGGVRFAIRPTVRTYTTYVPRTAAKPHCQMLQV